MPRRQNSLEFQHSLLEAAKRGAQPAAHPSVASSIGAVAPGNQRAEEAAFAPSSRWAPHLRERVAEAAVRRRFLPRAASAAQRAAERVGPRSGAYYSRADDVADAVPGVALGAEDSLPVAAAVAAPAPPAVVPRALGRRAEPEV